MKPWLLLCIFAWLFCIFALTGCMHHTPGTKGPADVEINLYYVMDTRTGLCFAYGGGTYVSVPCSAEVIRLIESGQNPGLLR